MNNNKGFTILEIAVAMSIFAIMISVTLGAFVKGFHSQSRIVNMQAVQRESSYLMEIMSREIRTASSFNGSMSATQTTNLNFSGHSGSNTWFCRANADGTCNASGEYFSMTGSVMNASDIRVTRLNFYIPQYDAGDQPLIIVNMELQSRKDSSVKMTLQSSVAMRLY